MTKVVSVDNSEHYSWAAGADGWHLLKSSELSVIEECVAPGGREERHSHDASQQFFYVLSGVACIEAQGETYVLQAGCGLHVPARVPHQFMNKGSTPVRFLVISHPNSHGDRVAI